MVNLVFFCRKMYCSPCQSYVMNLLSDYQLTFVMHCHTIKIEWFEVLTRTILLLTIFNVSPLSLLSQFCCWIKLYKVTDWYKCPVNDVVLFLTFTANVHALLKYLKLLMCIITSLDNKFTTLQPWTIIFLKYKPLKWTPIPRTRVIIHVFSGTFFLSVHKSHKSAIDILHNGYNRYLCAVCVGCLHGYSAKVNSNTDDYIFLKTHSAKFKITST